MIVYLRSVEKRKKYQHLGPDVVDYDALHLLNSSGYGVIPITTAMGQFVHKPGMLLARVHYSDTQYQLRIEACCVDEVTKTTIIPILYFYNGEKPNLPARIELPKWATLEQAALAEEVVPT